MRSKAQLAGQHEEAPFKLVTVRYSDGRKIQMVECPVCGRRSKNKLGNGIHYGKAHRVAVEYEDENQEIVEKDPGTSGYVMEEALGRISTFEGYEQTAVRAIAAKRHGEHLMSHVNPEVKKKLDGIFEFLPVPLDEFVCSEEYLGNPPLSKPQYDACRHLEQIYLPETYELLQAYDRYWTPTRWVNFAYLQWGKGSGKDHVCRVMVARAIYLLLCLRNPQRYFGMAPQDEIHTLNVAASAAQAYRAFFKPLKTMIDKSPWFRQHAHAELVEYSIRFGKQLEAVSGHSFMESLEGLNIIVGLADEISAFKTREEAEQYQRAMGGREPAKTAEAIMKMIRTSARTRFPRTFKVAAISYPRFKGDAIQNLCLLGREDYERHGEDSRIFVSGPLATWDVNPRVHSKDEFREDYEEDPQMARAMYECKPQLGVNVFFRNEVSVNQAFERKVEDPPLEITYWMGKDDKPTEQEFQEAEVDGWQVSFRFADELVPYRGVAYAIHADMAITGDSAGVAMCHVVNYTAGEWDKEYEDNPVVEMRPIVKVDLVTSFDADLTQNPPREIQIRWLRKLVYELLRRGFNIMYVTMDNFQSADTIQILNAKGIESKRYSTDRGMECWETLRDVMYDGRLQGYFDERTCTEIKALGTRVTGNGTKIDHPPMGSKDRADAIAGAVMGALYVGGHEGTNPERADEQANVDLSVHAGMVEQAELSLAGIGLDESLLQGWGIEPGQGRH